MNNLPEQTVLQRAARRASQRPFFLASAISEFQSFRGMDDEALARWLGCPVAALPKLGLCRRPDGASPLFRTEVERIAAYAGADPVHLGQLLRECDSTTALQRAPCGGGHGITMAARDHCLPSDEGNEPPESESSARNQ